MGRRASSVGVRSVKTSTGTSVPASASAAQHSPHRLFYLVRVPYVILVAEHHVGCFAFLHEPEEMVTGVSEAAFVPHATDAVGMACGVFV